VEQHISSERKKEGAFVNVVESPKPSRSRKKIVLQALSVAVLLFVAYEVWMRRQPERLTTLAIAAYTDGYFKVSGDNLLMFVSEDSSGDNNGSLRIQSLRDHKTRPLVPPDPQYQFYRPLIGSGMSLDPGPYLWSVEGEEVYYAITPRLQPGVSSGPGPTQPPGSFSTYRMSSKIPSVAEIAEQKRFPLPQGDLPRYEVRFMQISLRGGSPREIVALRGENYCLIGAHVFWVRPGREDVVQVIQGTNIRTRKTWVETTTRSDLMLTSLTDGTTRCIRHGISRDPRLSRIETGVTWREFGPYPEKSVMFYAHASDGAVSALKPLTDVRSPTPLRDWGGRFYWTEVRHDGEEAAVQTTHEVLMSADMDGTDVREILNKVEQRSLSNITLSPDRGTLYCRLSELAMTESEPPRWLLCRLNPDKPGPVEILRKMPQGVGAFSLCDSGYLYFVQQEQKRSLSSPLQVNLIPALYRVPLNH